MLTISNLLRKRYKNPKLDYLYNGYCSNAFAKKLTTIAKAITESMHNTRKYNT